jgi:hypothetical protein
VKEPQDDSDNTDAAFFAQLKESRLPPEVTNHLIDFHAGLRHRQYEAECELQRVTFENVAKAGASALNVGLVINGGAAVAVLALVGHLATSSRATSISLPLPNLCIAFQRVCSSMRSPVVQTISLDQLSWTSGHADESSFTG